MQSNIYKKILEQIKKYNLASNFNNIEELNDWVLRLNKEQIQNLLSVDVQFENTFEHILCYKKFLLLNNEYFQHYVKCYAKADTDVKFKELEETTKFYRFHNIFIKKDLELIANAKTDAIAKALGTAARHGNSFSREYPFHERDMELIANAKTDTIAEELGESSKLYTTKYLELYHEGDMELIANAKTDAKAVQLGETARNNDSLKSEYHKKDMEYISNAPNEKVRLFGVISRNTTSLKSGCHDKDMECIAKADTMEKLKQIAGLFVDNIKHQYSGGHGAEYHVQDMEYILKADSDLKAKVLGNTVTLTSLDEKYHLQDMEYILNADTDEKIKKLGILATDHDSLRGIYHRHNFHKEDMEYVANAKTDKEVQDYVPKFTFYNSVGFKIDQIIAGKDEFPNYKDKCPLFREVIMQIKKYNFINAFVSLDHLYNWILSLNQKQIQNLLSVDVQFKLETVHNLLCGPKDGFYGKMYGQREKKFKIFLASKYYQHDVKLIAEADMREKEIQLYLTALNSDSLKSEYHESDMELIATSAKIDFKVLELGVVSRDINSLRSKHHKKDMEYIFNSRNSYRVVQFLRRIATSLGLLENDYHEKWMEQVSKVETETKAYQMSGIVKASFKSEYYEKDMELFLKADMDAKAAELGFTLRNQDSLDSGYHEKDMELINTAKTYIIARQLGKTARDTNSLHCEYHESDMMLIANAKTNIIAKSLGGTARDEDSLQSNYHESDMELIASAKSDTIAEELEYTSRNVASLQSEHHESDMKLISSGKTDIIVNELGETARDDNSLQNVYHKKDMELIANAQTDVKAKILGDLARDNASLESGYHETDMMFIFNAETNNKAKHYIPRYKFYQSIEFKIDQLIDETKAIPDNKEVDSYSLRRILKK